MLVCVALLALFAGCGKDAPKPGNAPDTLGYIPRDARAVLLVPTDLEGDQWKRFGKLVAPELKGSEFGTMRENVAAAIPDVNFDEQLAPLLGETLVVAAFGPAESPRVLAALHTPDAGLARKVAAGIRNGDAIADGRTLLVELDGGNHELDAAVDRHHAGTGLDRETFASRFGEGAEDDALVRLLTDRAHLLPGVQSAALSFRLDRDAIRLHVRAHATDPRRLERVLAALGRRGLHPFLGAKLGLVGDELLFEDSDGRTGVKLVPLGDPTADVQRSADVVEGDVTVPVPGGL